MSEGTTAVAGEAVPLPGEVPVPLPPTGSGLSTQSNEWELLAAQDPNKDAHVPITDLLFDGQTVEVIVQKPEIVAADNDGGGQAAKLSFELKGELKSVEGVIKPPGSAWRPRFSSIFTAPKVAPTEDAKKDKARKAELEEQVLRGLKDLHRLAVAAGALEKSNEVRGDILRSMGKVEGKVIKLKFTVTDGKKKDESGKKVKFQNVRYAGLNEVLDGNSKPQAGVNY